jgi:hypothetical protein
MTVDVVESHAHAAAGLGAEPPFDDHAAFVRAIVVQLPGRRRKRLIPGTCVERADQKLNVRTARHGSRASAAAFLACPWPAREPIAMSSDTKEKVIESAMGRVESPG